MTGHHPPTFRFAPSPNGALHLGHAYSALLNQELCNQMQGRLLLRIEDIDTARCRPELEQAMLDDLAWLGIQWQETPRRQSQHFSDYDTALDKLRQLELVYPSFMTRGEIRSAVDEKIAQSGSWPSDPDGSPLYPGGEKHWSMKKREEELAASKRHIWRLDMDAALGRITQPIRWQETTAQTGGREETIPANPALWGDVVLARSDTPTSYHLSVVVDDALQQVTHVVRGKDLYHATSVHRLLQTLLQLPAPTYHHHDLIRDEDGRKLSKSNRDTSLRSLRDAGLTPGDIKKVVGI